MHRYIPLIAKWNGFNKIAEKEVNHNRRKYGVTKFGMERYIRGFLDLLSVSFVYRFRKRPMHFFGSFGVLSFLLGFISAGFIIYEKISKLSQNVPLELIRPVTDQPLFYIALLAIIIGVQLFLVGFLSELIIQINSDKKGYKIEKTGNAQKNKFSIVVAVYNRPEEMYELLDSIVNQEFKDLEIIVVDDGLKSHLER